MSLMTRFEFYPPEERRRLELYAAEYVFQQDDPTPWALPRHALRECTAALVTTAGLRLKTQHEFAADRATGSADYREISIYTRASSLAFDFTNYDPREAERDLNVLVPVDRMRELVDERRIGGVQETFYSFYGLCTDVAALKASARRAAERCRADIALLFPANLVCNQTVGIVSREFERAGIATATLVTVREVAEQVRVPRPLFINHPFGRTLGRAGDGGTQKAIVLEMLSALESRQRPGKLVDLDFRWTGPIE